MAKAKKNEKVLVHDNSSENEVDNSVLQEIMSLVGNEYASIASNGTSADTSGHYSTGSYSLNALFSGDLFKGVPDNKIIALAGEESTGKTFFALAILKHFLEATDDSFAIIFESEGCITKDILETRGINSKRVLILPVETVQQFKNQAIRTIDNYLAKKEKDRKPMMFILDSLGMLSTSKEMADSESGKEVKDMTRTQEIKAAFRVLTLKLSKARIPMIVTNHVYQTMGMFPTKESSGGSGLKYSASSIIALSKSKEKDSSGSVTGAIVKCKTIKSRSTRENNIVKTLLSYDKGLDKYYGLVDLALETGVWEKMATKIKVDSETSVFETRINNNPEKYFTPEVLEKINEKVKSMFLYGGEHSQDLLNEDVLENILEGN